MIILILFSLMIPFILIWGSFFLSLKNSMNSEKLSAFECGYNSFFKLRPSFSLRFFMIALIFLIFDIEIIFIFPLTFSQKNSIFLLLSSFFLFTIILYGLFHEWMIGYLNWNK